MENFRKTRIHRNEPPARLSPFNLQAEQALLGCIMLDPLILESVRQPDIFFDLRHQNLLRLILEMAEASKPIDPHTVCNEAVRRKESEQLGGLAYLASLPDMTPSAANWGYYHEDVKDMALRRGIIQAASLTIADAYDTANKAQDVADAFEQKVMDIRRADGGKDQTVGDACQDVIAQLEERAKNPGTFPGLTTGYHDLDENVLGMRGGKMFVIAGRPSSGKTALGMGIIKNLAVDRRIPCGVFSLEMTTQQLVYRMACSMASVDSRVADTGGLEDIDFERLSMAFSRISGATMPICDTPGMSVQAIRAKTRRWVREHGIKLVGVDYLQLVTSTNRCENRRVEVAEISKGLRAMAKELGIHVIVIAQLSRESEKKERPPIMSDLAECAGIENDADIIGLLYRTESDGWTRPEENVRLTICKHRDGKTGAVNMLFNKRFTRYEELREDDPQQQKMQYDN